MASMKLNTRLFLNCLHDLSEDAAVWRGNDRGNNISFIAVHLIDARAYLARVLGADVSGPFGPDIAEASSLDEIEMLPTLDSLRSAWEEVSDRLLEQMQQVTEQTLMARADQDFPGEHDTGLGATAFLLHHESYHIGQMALLRRQLGLAPMSYATEPE